MIQIGDASNSQKDIALLVQVVDFHPDLSRLGASAFTLAPPTALGFKF